MNENAVKTNQPAPMKWVRKKSTLHVAEGAEGTFYIQESRRFGRRLFWVKYRSKKEDGKNFTMPPSGSLALAKLAAEDCYYWEDGTLPEGKKTEERPAAAPPKEIKRWDMKY